MPDGTLAGIGRVGAVGSLIGASMETAGHHGQSLLLDQFAGPLGMKLGGLLYLIGILGALITIASGGSYRFGLWLLFGPPLYFFLINVRSPSGGAEWKVGKRTHDIAEVEKGVRGLVGDTGAGDVSTFFSGWNRLTSGIVQGMVELIGLTDNGSDLDFMNKTDRYVSLWGIDTLDPRLKGFINATLVNNCADYFALRKRIANPMVENSEKDKARKLLEEHGKNGRVPVVNIKHDYWLQDWLKAVGLYEKYQEREDFSCDELWEIGIDAFKTLQAEQVVDILVDLGRPPGLTREQAREKLLWKFGQQVGNGDVIKEYKFADTPGGNGNGQADLRLTVLVNELAARLVSKEMSKLSPQLAALDMNEHPELVREGDHRFDEETSRSLRMLQSSDEYQYKGELIIGALTMPYIQGCVLYFLSVTFPFFALALILPGRHNAFLLWMSLWLWAKLWDFGFAVVMMIDNMLYALLPHGPAVTDDVVKDPGAAFKALLEVDPTYAAGTYYNLVSCCLLAVPVVTGFLVHRGGDALTQAVSQTYKDFPTKFGTSVAAYKRAMMAQHNLLKARVNEWDEFERGALAVAATDEKFQEQANTAAVFRAIKANLDNGRSALAGLDSPAMKAKFPGISKMKLGAIGDKATKLGGAYLETQIKQYDTAAKRQLAKSLQLYSHKISDSSYSRAMAGEAILNRFNSHDFRRNFPGEAIINSTNADQYAPTGAFWDSVYDMARPDSNK